MTRVYSVVPRVRDLAEYSPVTRRCIRWSDEYDFDGLLFFTGPGAVLDPWVAAVATVVGSERLCPIVALNPMYAHPYAAARMVASIAHLYGRRVALNLITGTATSEMIALGDELAHDDRYERLREYTEVVLALLTSPRPLTYDGRFYRLTRAQLLPAISPDLVPQLFLAGGSPAARAVATDVGAVGITMLSAHGTHGTPAGVRGIHFGVVTRPTEAAAWERARESFPDDPEGRALVAATIANTDAAWKRALFDADGGDDPHYWLDPFRSAQADCPYLVGSHDVVAERLATLVDIGVTEFILDLPHTEEDFRNVAEVVAAVRRGERNAHATADLG